ncbi:MAG: RsmD family RNA methyltransferase [Anaerolineales bacterium]|nr:RsmD family RNA methyltransferase [Anaerolineales bacterium]MCB8951477.1 RsmD family RNA methyltransferase [Ardenticatenales bacterium]
MLMVLSHFQAAEMLRAREAGLTEVVSSIDLRMTTMTARPGTDGVWLAEGVMVSWAQVAEIADNPTACYEVLAGEIVPIRAFSQMTGRFYSLLPTEGAPTMLVAGFPMHRIKGIDPHRDTLNKIKALGTPRGRLLDTATGLGYTAIEAAKTADEVVTVELDAAAQGICRRNPWSQGLFRNAKIRQIMGDSYEVIETFAAGTFSCILHDPPTFSLAGELYSRHFYEEAYRVLRARGRLFHYIGDPSSKSGANITRGVVRRLQEAGFGRVVAKPRAYGVVAYKSG